jgi:isopentenyl-diphosphate Delta-isomerase
MEQVILVDEFDNEIGTMEKMEAHHKGVLHRAFSILLFNENGELLIQKRADSKYHSRGLWTNTCCSHPRPGESVLEAAKRRLIEELGIQAQLEFAFKFIYKANLENEMIEHELDHVLIGNFNGEPIINLEEISSWKFERVDKLKADIARNGNQYTFWFKEILANPHLPLLNYKYTEVNPE